MGPLLVLVISLGAMWLLFILPQQRRVRAHQAVVARLQVGDEVMTTAGIYGTVTELDDEVVHLAVAPGTVIRVARGAVGRRLVEDVASPADALDAEPAGTAADRAAALDAPEPSDTTISEP